ncbi:ribosomal protein L17 [Candidatus Carsonella ruddii CS isolate Thao2000]|uniref:Ribosomal protein L17 n=1 Tax=Candidatus Carsonella ruddii CS isolate Thao2000 TaxID=1202537 RepID=J7GSS9_CARRU|nr:hypothetical protein [Candidatus Carsonella ruddii]AFP83807.1 ribosomal protein L17 [Candidatus Carsonella ruddii CS isolate Thao2000]
MNYKKKYIFINNCFCNLLKYGKIRSNFFKLKKIKKKMFKFLFFFLKKNFFVYLIKIKNRKGDNSLIGELGFIFKKYNNFLI